MMETKKSPEPTTGVTSVSPDKIEPMTKTGSLLVVTGPSGVGKGTIVGAVLDEVDQLAKSVSVTTRPRRSIEVEGEHYFFRSEEEFFAMQKRGDFLEYAEFAGNYYGTPRGWVAQELDNGIDVILEIEVQGAKQIFSEHPEAVMVFISPPNFDELASRLKNRKTETPEKIKMRLDKAQEELQEKNVFHYEVVNDKVEEAVNNLEHIVYAERNRIIRT